MSSPWLSPERLLGYTLILALWIPSAWVGAAVHLGIRVTLMLLTSWHLGQWLATSTWSNVRKLALGSTAWVGFLSLALTACYYASIPLQENTYVLTESLIALIASVAYCFCKPTTVEAEAPASSKKELALTAGFSLVALIAWIVLVRLLARQGTDLSVQTPWTLLPKGFFLLITLPFFASLAVAWRDRTKIGVAFTAALSWLSVSVITPLLYPLGYGFDGFIHRASQRLILTTGTLKPKPLYYIGQYVWTTWLVQAFDVALRTIDIWLVPVSVLLPLFALYVWTKDDPEGGSWRLPLATLLLPLGAFVNTTPQSFSYVVGFAALIAALWEKPQKKTWIVPIVWALWATTIHPLGGLPFLALVGGLWLADLLKARWKKGAVLTLATIGGLLAIPVAFWAQSKLGGASIGWSWEFLSTLNIGQLLGSFVVAPRQTLNVWVDGTEWAAICFQGLLLVVSLWQIIRPLKPAYRWLGIMGIGLLGVRWTLEHAAVFSFLIKYEQGNYTERLTILSGLMLAPGTAHWLETRLRQISLRSTFLFGGLLLAFAALWSVRVYDSLPRYDAAKASGGWNVSRADVEAVHWIREHAQGTNYAVLANQTVSASALETYGFLRYTNGDVFYYPLPTGGPLYQLFLKVSSVEGTKEDIKQAAVLTQSKTIYVVIDKYWWNADRVNEQLTGWADQAVSFEDGSVWVYRFEVEG